MLAYDFNPALKADAVATAVQHREADKLIKGTYWENGKGCAIGCWTHTSEKPHQKVSDKYHLPVELLYLVDGLFEQLPDADAQLWPQQFAEAIQPGANLDLVAPKVMLWTLMGPKGVINICEVEETQTYIRAVAAIYEEWIRSGEKPTHDCPLDVAARAAWAAWAASSAWEAREALAARAARAAWEAQAARGTWEAWKAWAARAAWRTWDEYTRARRAAVLMFIAEAK